MAQSDLDTNLITQQAQSLYREVRCMACDGQIIAESDAPLAVAMREYIMQQLQQGQSEMEIKTSLVQAYGSDVLQAPPKHASTLVLWYAPFVVLIVIFSLFIRRLWKS